MIHNNRLFNQPQPLLITRERTSLDSENGDISTQLVNEAPEELTIEEKEAKIENIIKQFVSGNMTRFEAEQELDELGINCASSDNANDRVLNFEFNNKKYQITCSRVAANDGKGGNVVETITPEEVNAVVQKYGDDAKKYFKAVATVDGKPTAYALDFTNWPEGVNKTLAALQTELAKPKESAEEKAVREFIENYTNSDTDISGDNFEILKNLLSAAGISYKEEQQTVFGKVLRGLEFEFGGVTHTFYTNEAATNAPADDFTSTSPAKFKESQLAGLDDNAIMRYFTRREDGTYVMNEANITADFPEAKYGKIDTPEKLKKAIADSVKADTTGSIAGAGGAGATGGTNGAGSTNDSGSVAPKDEVTGGGNNDTTPAVNNSATGTFKSYTETRYYIFSNEARDAVKAAGITDFSKGFAYENIADTVAKAHEKDFASITKEQLIEEFKTEYNKRIGGNNGTGEVNGTGTGNAGGAGGAGGVGGTDVTDSVAQPTEAQKGQAKSTVMNEVMKAYTTGNGDYGITTKHSDAQCLRKFSSKVANAIDEFAKSYTGSADGYLKALQDHIKTVVPALIQEVEDEIKAGEAGNTPATQYTKEDLQKTYHLTDSDIGNFFKKNGDKYEINTTATKSCFGKEINNVQNLLNAMQKEPIAIGYIYGAYSMGSDKYLQYFTVTGEGNDRKFTMNMTKIKQDFPDKNITTIGQLKAAVDAKGSTTGGTSGTNGTDGTRGNGETAPADNKNTETLKTAYKNVNKTISNVANWLGILLADTTDKINGKFDYDSSGNIDLKDSNTKTIFNNIVDKIVSVIGNDNREEFLETIGGKDGLKKLVQSAWIMAYSSYASDKTDIKTKDFVNKVMENLQKIMQNLQQNPDNLEYLTDDCYKDSDLANTSTTKLNTKEFMKYDNDGLYHLDDDTSDKNFQEAMDAMLEKLYNKYPNISKAKIRELFVKAQGEALTSAKNGTDIPAGCNINRTTAYKNVVLKAEMSVKDIVQLVAYKFDKLFKAECLNSTLPAREVEAKPTAAKSNQTTEQNSAISEGANGIASAVKYVKDTVVNACKGAITKQDKNNIHTEFGMDSSGNIVFQEKDTKAVFDTIFSSLKSSIGAFANDALTKLGGESALKKLVQAAWIAAYNDFDSSQSNNVTNFVNKVMSNLETMINKLKTNPELFEVYTKCSSYADTSVTKGVKHYNTNTTYGNDETINYGGNITTFTDGTVHLSVTTDDNDYQTTMSGLLKNLITKYSSVNSDTVTKVFRDAQKKALEALQGNKFDCPYGTGNNSGRVEDWRKDWGGRDNRKKDKSNIHMDQLVQMTLYYFDKLILKEMMK